MAGKSRLLGLQFSTFVRDTLSLEYHSGSHKWKMHVWHYLYAIAVVHMITSGLTAYPGSSLFDIDNDVLVVIGK